MDSSVIAICKDYEGRMILEIGCLDLHIEVIHNRQNQREINHSLRCRNT